MYYMAVVDAVPPNLSRRVTEKKRKRTTKNAFRNPSRRVARAPRNVQPRALSRRQKASRVPTSTAARVSRVAKKVVVVVVRVSSFLSSKSVSSFLMTAQKGPPFTKCEKVSAFFFFFLFFFWTKKSAFFSLFFLSFFLSFFLLLWMFWTRGEEVFTELHFCDREFCIAPRSNNPLFCFPTQHLQATHLQEEHQRGGEGFPLFWDRTRVVGARAG